jgi:SAM-dependent methyltransferase
MPDSKTATDRLCRKPSGFWGRLMLRRMNRRHSPLTDWGLAHISIAPDSTVLDIGCGGGRTISKLAAAARDGKVFGLDHSQDSVAASTRTNAGAVSAGRVEIRQGSVSALPWPDNTFDLITAIETHFFWPNLPGDMREVLRVLRPGGTFLLIAEIYKGATTAVAKLAEKRGALAGMSLLTPDEHRDLLAGTGFSDVRVSLDAGKGWICCTVKKPTESAVSS